MSMSAARALSLLLSSQMVASHASGDADLIGEVHTEVEVDAATGKVDPSCTKGRVSLIHSWAPKCINNCQSACPAIGEAMQAYSNGGEEAAYKSVCNHKD